MKDAKAAHSEDWSHLGKPDTGAAVANTGRGLLSGIRGLFRRAVRYERAVWSSLAAGGLPSPVVAVLKWSVRLGLGGYLVFKSLPMLTVGLAYALTFVLQYGLGILGVVGILVGLSYVSRSKSALGDDDVKDISGDSSPLLCDVGHRNSMFYEKRFDGVYDVFTDERVD